jgi:F420-dependent oxidoreductase-like protein
VKYSVTLPLTPAMRAVTDIVEFYESQTRIAQLADECGYEAVYVPDHFAHMDMAMWFECWTTTAALARDTRRIRIGQTVTCNGFRNPALLAKMASTVDVLSHGRLILGIGAGDSEPEFRAYGYQWNDAPTRLRQLEEAIQVILAMWTQDEATFDGNYYRVHRAVNEPKGVQKPHIPLLIGGGGEKVTLKLVAKYADACEVIGGDLATLKHKYAVLKAHCEAVGRDYESIHRVARRFCLIRDTDEQARNAVPETVKAKIEAVKRQIARPDIASGSIPDPAEFVGSAATIRQRIALYADAGVHELQLAFIDATPLESLLRFANEFVD